MRFEPLFLLALLLLTSLPLRAGTTDDAGKALLAIDASWNSLRLEADVEGLERLLCDDWLLTHSDGRVQDKADYLRELSNRTRANQVIENQDVELRLHGDTAVVTGTSVQAGTRDGQPWNGRFRFTRTWILREGNWRMLASHSSRIATQE
ncbi:MAG: nuclear transport factor 2 family protein [Pseudoxanthomonas sp.]